MITLADVIPAAVISGVGISQALPITFTNISGVDQTVNGIAMYDNNPTFPPSSPLLMNVQGLSGGPVVIPNGGTIVIPVLIGDSSQLSS